ncbi:MAG: hypothetical protein H6765_05325 [Candidatus Peribacteria bacterium]|nr:MAG: hypothetical protein H6765_05325 [Candidatus Peribacteria bacterium]
MCVIREEFEDDFVKKIIEKRLERIDISYTFQKMELEGSGGVRQKPR